MATSSVSASSSALPPLPPGFTLDAPPGASASGASASGASASGASASGASASGASPSGASLPPLPPGFTLDRPANASPSTPPETFGRVAGLGARALVDGGVGMVGGGDTMIGRGLDALTGAESNLIHGRFSQILPDARNTFEGAPSAAPAPAPSNAPPQLSDFVHPGKWENAANYFANKAGLPTPATPAERIGSAAVGALPGMAMAPEDPEAAAADAGVLARAWAAARTPLALAGSGAASQAVTEAGGSPLESLAAGVGGPLLTSGAAGLTRGLVRGFGADAAKAAAERIAQAKAAGIQLSPGEATGSKLLNRLAESSGRLWGGDRIDATSSKQAKGLGIKFQEILNGLTPNDAPSAENAGRAIEQGVAGTKTNMRNMESEAYDRLRGLVPRATPVNIQKSRQLAENLAAPTANDSLNSVLASPKLRAFQQALTGSGDTMPYGDLARLRSAVGNSIDYGFSPSDASGNAALKQLYGSLSDDLHDGATAVSPEAAKAAMEAKTVYHANEAIRENLNEVVGANGGPEAIYKAAMSGSKNGGTRLSGLMKALPPEQANLFRAQVLQEMGRLPPSARDGLDDVFGPSTFLTRWGQLSKEAKNAIFGTSKSGSKLRDSLDAIGGTVGVLRDDKALPNPSGTSGALSHAFGLHELLGKAAEIGMGVATGGTALEHGAGLAGIGGAAAAGGAGAIGANMLLSRALTNPEAAAWLARRSVLARSALPASLEQLEKYAKRNQHDTVANDFARYLRATGH